MQNQTGFSDKLAIAAPTGGLTAGEIVEAGDTLGIAYDTVAETERAILAIRGEMGHADVIAAESWSAGAQVYWHETLKRFTNRETHWPAGRIGEDKAADIAYGIVQLDGPDRKPGELIAPFKYEDVQDIGGVNFGAQADYTLRDFGGNVQVVQAELVSAGLTADTVTIALGDGSGSNDQLLAAFAASGLSGFDDIPGLVGGAALPVTLDKVVLRLAGTGAFTAGLLVVRIGYVPAA